MHDFSTPSTPKAVSTQQALATPRSKRQMPQTPKTPKTPKGVMYVSFIFQYNKIL